jgi:translocation and assembly module TamA
MAVKNSPQNPRLDLILSLVALLFCFSTAYGQDSPTFEVSVTGLEGEALKNVQLALSPPEGIIEKGQVDELLLSLFLKETPRRVREALEPFGYYQPRVRISLERHPGRLFLTVGVAPGEPVRISDLKIDIKGPGTENKRLMRNLPVFPLKVGDILQQVQYQEGKKGLLKKIQEAGYVEAKFFVHLIRLSLEKNSAQIDLVLETGPRFYFGQVTFVPPLSYPESFLKRYLAFKPGGPFSPEKLARTQLNFINSDRFLTAVVEADQKEARDDRIPVRITLIPSKPKRFKFGLGYETDQGPGLVIGYHDLNFNHRGHELNAQLNFAQLLQGLAVDYTIPSKGTLDNKTVLKAGYKREITDTYESRSFFSQYEYDHRFGRGRLGAGYLQLLREDYSIAGQEDMATMLMPGVRFDQRRFNDPVLPSRGYHYSIEARGSAPFLGSVPPFLQFLPQADSLTSLGKGFSLLLRFQGGLTIENTSLNNLPPSLRFFAGGDNNVRGYAYQSLGPTNASGKVIGGKHLLVGSLEIDKAITKIWGLAAFYDVGNAFDDFRQIELKQGAGLGVRFYTPVGPIRIDLARQIGVSNPQFRLHLSVGFGL